MALVERKPFVKWKQIKRKDSREQVTCLKIVGNGELGRNYFNERPVIPWTPATGRQARIPGYPQAGLNPLGELFSKRT